MDASVTNVSGWPKFPALVLQGFIILGLPRAQGRKRFLGSFLWLSGHFGLKQKDYAQPFEVLAGDNRWTKARGHNS